MIEKNTVPKRERILDSAEALFAEHGYDGVALRQIARCASVDVALASYHFGKKRDLFQAVFERLSGRGGKARAERRTDHQGVFRRCKFFCVTATG